MVWQVFIARKQHGSAISSSLSSLSSSCFHPVDTSSLLSTIITIIGLEQNLADYREDWLHFLIEIICHRSLVNIDTIPLTSNAKHHLSKIWDYCFLFCCHLLSMWLLFFTGFVGSATPSCMELSIFIDYMKTYFI